MYISTNTIRVKIQRLWRMFKIIISCRKGVIQRQSNMKIKRDYETQKRNQKLNQEKKDLVEFAWKVLLSELCNTHEINALILASLLTLGYVVVYSFMYVNKITPEVICKLPTSSNGGNSTDHVYVKKIGCYKYRFCWS